MYFPTVKTGGGGRAHSNESPCLFWMQRMFIQCVHRWGWVLCVSELAAGVHCQCSCFPLLSIVRWYGDWSCLPAIPNAFLFLSPCALIEAIMCVCCCMCACVDISCIPPDPVCHSSGDVGSWGVIPQKRHTKQNYKRYRRFHDGWGVVSLFGLLELDIPYFIERQMLKHQLRRGLEAPWLHWTCVLNVHENLENGRWHAHERILFPVNNIGCRPHIDQGKFRPKRGDVNCKSRD